MADLNQDNQDCEYTDIDLNDTSTTSTVYDSSGDAKISYVTLNNGGGSADVQLEVTDGSSTVVLANPSAGNGFEFTSTLYLSAGDSLQVNVTTAEGSAQTNTCVVSRSE